MINVYICTINVNIAELYSGHITVSSVSHNSGKKKWGCWLEPQETHCLDGWISSGLSPTPSFPTPSGSPHSPKSIAKSMSLSSGFDPRSLCPVSSSLSLAFARGKCSHCSWLQAATDKFLLRTSLLFCFLLNQVHRNIGL